MRTRLVEQARDGDDVAFIMLRAEDGSVEEIQPLVDSIVWR